MTSEHLLEELGAVVATRVPLQQVVSTLRSYRERGVTRDEVRSALQTLRERASDEETEDRILEVMDIASGFCTTAHTVWEG